MEPGQTCAGAGRFLGASLLGKVTKHRPQVLKGFRLALNTNMFLGVLILLLTTIALSAALP